MTPQEKMNFKRLSETEIEVSRVFAAPRALVFDAFTKAEHLKRWMGGWDDTALVCCMVDFRVGGAFRYVWRSEKAGDIGMDGRFREITPAEKIVHTEIFDQDWTGGEALVTTLFADEGAGTRVTTTIAYSSAAACDGVLKSDMLAGWSHCYDRLEELLSEKAQS
ncbi:MAG: SRPBCC family protein [Parvularculaceae bacterium]